jgi:DNA-binding transcriptional LysR family regulator
VPELRRLRAFVAVAEELNFTRAAQRLHLGQQAVSKSVALLERELGVALLERTTREVRLTAAGAALLEAGREALAAADAAFARAREVGRGLAGEVRVGVTPAVGPATRDEVIRVLRSGAPEVSVAFHEVRPGNAARALRDRAVDVVLARTERGDPDVESAPLRPSPAELLVPAGHRLAGAAAAGLADLHGELLLTWSSPGTPYTDLLVGRIRAAGAEVRPVRSPVTGTSEAPDLAEAGAVALVPSGWPPGRGNVRVPVTGDVSLPLLLLWPAGLPSPAVHRLRVGMGPAGGAAP